MQGFKLLSRILKIESHILKIEDSDHNFARAAVPEPPQTTKLCSSITPEELIFGHMLRKLEHHVIKEMGETGPTNFLARRTNMVEDRSGSYWVGLIFVEHHLKAWHRISKEPGTASTPKAS